MKDIIKFYGKENQSKIAMEECAELIQAISKVTRYPGDKDRIANLTEEIADVLICIQQLQIMYHIDDKNIYIISKNKLKRVRKRIRKDKIKC